MTKRKLTARFAAVFNILARLVGVLFVLGGATFVIGFFTVSASGVIDLLVGLAGVAIGSGLILVKGITPEAVERVDTHSVREKVG